MNFDLSSFIDKKTLVGIALGADLVWIGEWAKSYYKRKQNAHYLAVRLIPVLEQFLDGCYEVAYDDGTAEGQPAGYSKEGQFLYYVPQADVPEFILPNDVDWQIIDKKLVESIMTIPTEMHKIEKSLDSDLDLWHGDQSEGIYIRQVEYSKFSIKIDDILKNVKKIIKQKTIQDEKYNPRKRCEAFVATAIENTIKAEEAREKQFLEMSQIISVSDKEAK